MYQYDFDDKLKHSKSLEVVRNAIRILKKHFLGCSVAEVGSKEKDILGADYIINAPNSKKLYVDEKTRERGCSIYWKENQPELAPEIWSVMPGGKFNVPKNKSKVGWTLDDNKITDLILHTFHKQDTLKYYILPFDLYKNVFKRNLKLWKSKYKVATQISNYNNIYWQSQCVFIPAIVIINAIEEMRECQNEIPEFLK